MASFNCDSRLSSSFWVRLTFSSSLHFSSISSKSFVASVFFSYVMKPQKEQKSQPSNHSHTYHQLPWKGGVIWACSKLLKVCSTACRISSVRISLNCHRVAAWSPSMVPKQLWLLTWPENSRPETLIWQQGQTTVSLTFRGNSMISCSLASTVWGW
jgi:hypothetical protein